MQIPLAAIDVSQFNTRKDLADGEQDSSIDDLASSMARQGLLNPITVIRDGPRYALVAGQRRYLAARRLGWTEIAAIVRDPTSDSEAVAISLIENVHRADMNPRDKAVAFGALLDQLGDVEKVSRETGVGRATIRKYLQLLSLAPQLQEKLAAGEARNTQALADLARQFADPVRQLEVWDRIGGFRQDVQQAIIAKAAPDLSNLDELVSRAAEGELGYRIVRNCPFDCPEIPDALKGRVAEMIHTIDPGRRAATPTKLN
jgi:ParB family chromosome partitioning protein